MVLSKACTCICCTCIARNLWRKYSISRRKLTNWKCGLGPTMHSLHKHSRKNFAEGGNTAKFVEVSGYAVHVYRSMVDVFLHCCVLLSRCRAEGRCSVTFLSCHSRSCQRTHHNRCRKPRQMQYAHIYNVYSILCTVFIPTWCIYYTRSL